MKQRNLRKIFLITLQFWRFYERELYQKEVVLKQKEVELTTKSKSNEAFYAALKEFHSRSGDVNLSTEVVCDHAYSKRYEEAEGRLNALEGMAKENGKYSSYENFFREKHGSIYRAVNLCKIDGL